MEYAPHAPVDEGRPSVIHLMPQADHHRARHACAALEHHLAVWAVLEGTATGAVYVDDPIRPTAALVRSGYRFHLAGQPGNQAFTDDLGRLFSEDVYPKALASTRASMFVLYYAAGWEADIEAALQGKCPLMDERVCLEWRPPLAHQSTIPSEFVLRTVERPLLSEDLQNLDALQAEMCSERPSVHEFPERGIGVCAVRATEIVGWCLSEYNTGHRCEVGIEVLEPYRRRGLGAAMASALVERAQQVGITRIGWEAWAANRASIATALKVGFEQIHRYPVYYAWFDEADNLSANGNARFRSGEYTASLEWFERAFRTGRAPAWAYFLAACANAHEGGYSEALRALRAAKARGFGDLEAIQSSPHLEPLRRSAGWEALLDDLRCSRRPIGCD